MKKTVFLRYLLSACVLWSYDIHAESLKNASRTTQAPLTAPGKTRINAVADWTVVIFIEARNNLNSFAGRDLKDMLKVGSTDKINILAQWYQPHQTPRRCRIEKNNLNPQEYYSSSHNSADNLVEAMTWAKTSYPAKHYGLILWGHGTGIYDPPWDNTRDGWSVNMQNLATPHQSQMGLFGLYPNKNNPRTLIDGITYNTTATSKGILYNEIDRTYMNNQDMVRASAKIVDILGKKIAVFCMDACLMAMAEVAYQIKDCADYLVASQEVELAIGYDYTAFLAGLTTFEMTPALLAQTIVVTYENYQSPRTHLYTQSAIKLENLEFVRQNIDQTVVLLKTCRTLNKDSINKCIVTARRRCQQFSSPTFIDLHSFYKELNHQIENLDMNVHDYKNTSAPFYAQLKKLQYTLTTGMKLIEDTVIANVAGPYLSKAKGISIYFPCGKIDNSYLLTHFAKDSLWLDFLTDTLYPR